MNPIREFYNDPYFEKLKLTKPFKDYLSKEEEELRQKRYHGLSLDIGCGRGRSTHILSDICDKVIGIDFSERLLEQAKGQLETKSNIELYLEDATSTRFKDNSFDYAFMLWNTFGNLYDSRDKVLEEAKRIIKPEGKIILSVFSEHALTPYLEMLRKNNLRAMIADENYVFLKEGLVSERFDKNKLNALFKKQGLKSEIKSLTDITYWCELRK